MLQLNLLGGGSQPLLDDASGRIVLTRECAAEAVAQRWFAQLLGGIHWQAGTRMMYEREVEVPRLRAHFRIDEPAIPTVLLEATALVTTLVAAPFNSIGLNLYRDERDSVAPHNDTLSELVRGQPIALLSLGATRHMTIRSKQRPRRVLRLDLAAGSLLLMSWETQLHYDHGIPKQSAPAGPRISLAFRGRGAS